MGMGIGRGCGASHLTGMLRRLLLVAEQQTADQSDLHLLDLFVATKDEAAFAALVERHLPMATTTSPEPSFSG